MLIPACRLVQVFISLFRSLSLLAQGGWREEEERKAMERKQTNRGVRRGLGGGGAGVVFDTPADDRLMNLWMESAGAVLLWATADNNRR